MLKKVRKQEFPKDELFNEVFEINIDSKVSKFKCISVAEDGEGYIQNLGFQDLESLFIKLERRWRFIPYFFNI